MTDSLLSAERDRKRTLARESQRAIPTILFSTTMKGEPRAISLSSRNVRFFLRLFKDVAFISRS